MVALFIKKKEDIINFNLLLLVPGSPYSIYQVYVGSFDSHDAALETLEVINKIGSPTISEVFTVVSGIFGSRKSFRLETIRGFSYEKAKQYCDELVSYNLECKVISG